MKIDTGVYYATAKTRGYIRPLDRENTIQSLQKIHRLYPAAVPAESLALIMNNEQIDQAWFLHNISNQVKNALDDAMKLPAWEAFVGEERAPEVIPQFISYAIIPNRYDFVILFKAGYHQDDMDRALKNVAKRLDLDVWDELLAAIPPSPHPSNPGGFIRVFDESSLAQFVRSDPSMIAAAADNPMTAREQVEMFNSLRQAGRNHGTDWRYVQISQISHSLIAHLKYSLQHLTYFQLPNGMYEAWCTIAGDNADKRVGNLAAGLGLETFRHDHGLPILKILHTGKPHKLSASEALAMQNDMAMLFQNYASEISERANWPGVMSSRSQIDECVGFLAQSLPQSELVLWREDMWLAGLSGADVFTDTVLTEDFIESIKPAIWTAEQTGMVMNLGLPIDFNLPERSLATALLIFKVVEEVKRPGWLNGIAVSIPVPAPPKVGFTVAVVFNPPETEPAYTVSPSEWLPRLRILPALFPGQPVPKYWSTLIAALNFIALPIISKERIHPPHHERRRAEREKRELSPVHVIYLRRIKKAVRSTEGMTQEQIEAEMEREKREYSYQWLVGGHWRNQWYPSIQGHKQVYIAPYFKGDPALPFKAPGQKIYKVAR